MDSWSSWDEFITTIISFVNMKTNHVKQLLAQLTEQLMLSIILLRDSNFLVTYYLAKIRKY